MGTSLSPAQRAQLDSIVQKMEANGETEAYIRGVVGDFKTKYAAPAQVSRRDIMDALPTMLPGVSAGTLANIAPQALGFTGGLFGGPGGAAAGGTLGETARQALMEEQLNPKGIVTQGIGQGLLQGAGSAAGAVAGAAGPMAQRAASLLKKPLVRKLMRAGNVGLPLGGALSHGIPGALAGAVAPMAGKAAMNLATSPKTAALLSSPAFQQLAKQSPRAAGELLKAALASEGE